MSYESMAREEFGCDFPGSCPNNFDATKGARVAAIHKGDIVAFCQSHSAVLLMRGVNLRTLQQIKAELDAARGIPLPRTMEDLQARLEQEFIASLK